MSNTRSLAYGYVTQVFSENNDQYIFEDTPENIASFIVTNRNHQCTITDIGDNLIVTSLPGGFIDRCPNQTLFMSSEKYPAFAIEKGTTKLSERITFDSS